MSVFPMYLKCLKDQNWSFTRCETVLEQSTFVEPNKELHRFARLPEETYVPNQSLTDTIESHSKQSFLGE
jgi:hypothetical protein